MSASNAWFGIAVSGLATLIALIAIYTDGRWREIPNWLVAGLILLWAVAAWFAPEVLGTAPRSGLICGAVGLAAGYGFHALGWLGGGDGKLLAALALWLGPKDIGLWLLATATLGLVLALLALSRPTGDFRSRGIPFAWAIVPPAATLLIARAIAFGAG